MSARSKPAKKLLHYFFYVRAVWCKCFQGMLSIISLWRGLVGSVFSINVIETSRKRPLCSLSQKLFPQVSLYAWYAMHMFMRVRSKIIPPIAKSINCLTYILSSTFASTFDTNKKINKAFLNAVKSMIDVLSFSCNRIGKNFCLINICTNLAT